MVEMWIIKKLLRQFHVDVRDEYAGQKQLVKWDMGTNWSNFRGLKILEVKLQDVMGNWLACTLDQDQFYYLSNKRSKIEIKSVKVKICAGFGMFHSNSMFPAATTIYTYPLPLESTSAFAKKVSIGDETLSYQSVSKGHEGEDYDQLHPIALEVIPDFSKVDWKRYSRDAKLFEKRKGMLAVHYYTLDYSNIAALSEAQRSHYSFVIDQCLAQETSWQIDWGHRLEGPLRGQIDKRYSLRPLC